MKTFTTSGTGGGQTLSEIETDKIPVYNSKADVEADLANLSAGQIVGIDDTGDELSHPVDVVEEDNLHAVTSNAVAEAIGGSKIKTYQFTLEINSSSGFGYTSINNIPTDIVADGDNCNVLNCFFWWGAINNSKGLQVNLVNANNGTAFFIYYKPSAMAENINIKGKIYYIV